MGRIWRGLKLGHEEPAPAQAPLGPDGAGDRLRRGGGDLDAGRRRGVQPRRPGADPGSSGPPTSSSARSSRATRPRPTGGRPPRDPQLRPEVRGLRPDHGHRADDQEGLPIREIRKQIRHLNYYLDGRVVGTTHDYAEFNRWRSTAGRFLTEPPTTRSTRTTPCSAAETARKLFPYEDPIGQSVKLGRDYYTVIGVTKERAAARRGSAAAWPPRSSTRTSTSP